MEIKMLSPELGHFALLLALCLAVLQGALPLYGYFARQNRLLASGASFAQAQFFAVLIAYLCLTQAFIDKDFSVLYVAQNCHSDLPLIYRLSAVWGGHEGSLLLWLLTLSVWTLAVSFSSKRLPQDLAGLVLSVLGWVAVGFVAFIVFTSNPFDRIFPVPLEGKDLNPLLQDPGLIIHPPMLYMGYVGFSVAFAFAIAALITGKLDTAWARWTRPWTTAAWLFLTAGITLGSWWAYHELGWGGWWFWDPVENASFMPWLVGTALVHSLAATEKRGVLKSWTVLLAILAFSLSLLGTFLVRSGVLVSVHAFAADPQRGLFILIFLAVVVGLALTLYAWRAPKLAAEQPMQLASREGWILLNNVFLLVSSAMVLIGTLYPLVIDAFAAGKISVGPPYFNALFVPLMLPLLALVGFSGRMGWKKGSLKTAVVALRLPLLVALLSALLPWAWQGSFSLFASVGTVFGVWVLITSVQEVTQRISAKKSWKTGLLNVPRGVWGMSLAHAGLGLWTLGISMVVAYGVEKDLRLSPKGQAELSGYTFTFDGATELPGPNYTAQQGTVRVSNGGDEMILKPEKRYYPSQRNVMTEAAVDKGVFRDVYVAMGEPVGDSGDWALRLYYKPLIRWIWWGGALMFFGGILAASDKRYRLEKRRESAVPVGVPA
jgi:cytochrome c-type biogenesis protein CcmF